MPEDRWIHGKAAASPRSGATWASENAARVLAGSPRKRGRLRRVRTGGPGGRKETSDRRHTSGDQRMPLTSVTRRSAHRHRYTRSAGRLVVGLALVGATALYLVPVADGSVLASTAAAVLADPLGLTVVIACYATAFVLRAWAWRRTLPGLPFGQAWAALHVSLLGNHVLPF